jgi:D-galactarolactone cycloisomerase
LAENVKPVRITNVDIFRIAIPIPREQVEAGCMSSYTVAKVETDAGVRGYSFAGPSPELLDRAIRPALIGKDLFAIEDHLKAGLIAWGGLEHALWDAIGKIAGQPVYRLFGGSKSSLRVYLTCVWKGPSDQSHVSYREQADMAVKIKNAGFKGMKIRAWRPNPLDDAEACRAIREAVGADFAVMFDRTAHLPGRVWDFDTALAVARALEKHGAYWLEEPFDRADFLSPARLARKVNIPITGGEGYRGLDSYRECLIHDSYDILQPDAGMAGGILAVRKIAAMAEAFHKPVILHGSMGLSLAGWLQASAAIGAPWQELALITPPLLPEEQWSPALKVLNRQTVFAFRNGEIQVPEQSGLGLEISEEALERWRAG